MNYLKVVLTFFKKNLVKIITKVVLLLLIVIHIHYRHTTGKKIDHLINLYGKVKYDINKLPNGLVIYKSEKALIDKSTGMVFYEIGIWDYINDFVHYVRVPYYAHNRFNVGMEIRAKQKQKNSEKKRIRKSKSLI